MRIADLYLISSFPQPHLARSLLVTRVWYATFQLRSCPAGEGAAILTEEHLFFEVFQGNFEKKANCMAGEQEDW